MNKKDFTSLVAEKFECIKYEDISDIKRRFCFYSHICMGADSWETVNYVSFVLMLI